MLAVLLTVSNLNRMVMKLIRMITKQRALQIIADHGFGPMDQTAVDTRQPLVQSIDYDGRLRWSYPWVKSGTSFYETLGNNEEYTKRSIYDWLGY